MGGGGKTRETRGERREERGERETERERERERGFLPEPARAWTVGALSFPAQE